MNVKGVIVAAGYGSRFLPATKTVPKEMLPLIDRPAIDFIVDEFLTAGIRDILIITSRRKKALDDYFDRETELEGVFSQEAAQAKQKAIEPPAGNFYFMRQQTMQGTGQALLLAKTFVGADPFVVAYPDDIVLSKPPLAAQLIEAYQRTGNAILAVQDLTGQDVSRYGVVEPAGPGSPVPIRRLVEKPAPGQEPSSLVSYGRYLFLPDLFDHLEAGWQAHQQGEFYHVDAINCLAGEGKVSALPFQGLRLDTGAPIGYLEAICRYALTREDLAGSAKSLFRRLADEDQ